MKKLLSIIILFSSYFCNAQNYQCLQSGVKHYFTNGNGYLRGIRIDSVRTSGSDIIYYPFHTPRGIYETHSVVIPWNDSLPILDSNGGSWLGKKVIQHSDGTFVFDDIWSDSVIIKTQANFGSSWIFYKDTSSLYYIANIVSIDTMAILGSMDTVKTILINAYNGTTLVTTDPVNNFQIILSKNHGFVQVFDLYTFPYHLSDTTYTSRLDYYLDNCIHSSSDPYSPFSIPISPAPSQSNSIFNLISFINSTKQQLYDWNIGDIYEYTECFTYRPSVSGYCDPPMEYMLDTIKTKNTTTTNTQYTFTGLISDLLGVITYSGPYFYSTTTNSGTLTYDTSLLIDTTFMPEEYKQLNLYYYYPDDTGYCTNSTLYVSIGNYLYGGVQYQPLFESTTPTIINKMHLGLIHYYQSSVDASYYVNDKTLIYHYKAGQPCGIYVDILSLPDKVSNISTNNSIILSPNPATTLLTITATNKINNITITNLLGQTVYTHEYNNEKAEVNVANLPTGVYFVKINGPNSYREVRKFLKE